MNELVKFQDDNGNQIQVSAQDVKDVLCPNASEKEIAMFLALCQAQRLNPWIKDVYLIKYGNAPASMVTGKEVFTKRANANERYEGFESGVTYIDRNGEVKHREGSAVYKAAGETLVGGWCRVFVKGRKPFFDEVTLEEYSTGKSGWAKMPATMIRKVALVHALREAFPDDFQGLYSQEEMGKAGEMVEAQPAPNVNADTGEVIEAEVIEEAPELIAQEQVEMLNELAARLAELRGVGTMQVVQAVTETKALKELGYTDKSAEMTREQATGAIRLLRAWIEKALAKQFEQEEEAAPEPELANEDIPF